MERRQRGSSGRGRRRSAGANQQPRRRRHDRAAATKPRAGKKWSQHVTRTSNALDLEPDVFKHSSPRQVANSLRRSALRSKRRKASPYQSALSMLNFYINRAGKNLAPSQKRVLERAKGELARVFRRGV
jgi:hypothetical protein